MAVAQADDAVSSVGYATIMGDDHGREGWALSSQAREELTPGKLGRWPIFPACQIDVVEKRVGRCRRSRRERRRCSGPCPDGWCYRPSIPGPGRPASPASPGW